MKTTPTLSQGQNRLLNLFRSKSPEDSNRQAVEPKDSFIKQTAEFAKGATPLYGAWKNLGNLLDNGKVRTEKSDSAERGILCNLGGTALVGLGASALIIGASGGIPIALAGAAALAKAGAEHLASR